MTTSAGERARLQRKILKDPRRGYLPNRAVGTESGNVIRSRENRADPPDTAQISPWQGRDNHEWQSDQTSGHSQTPGGHLRHRDAMEGPYTTSRQTGNQKNHRPERAQASPTRAGAPALPSVRHTSYRLRINRLERPATQ